MSYYVFAFIVTIIVGFVGGLLNIPDAGAVFAIAAMGVFLLQSVNKKNDADKDEK